MAKTIIIQQIIALNVSKKKKIKEKEHHYASDVHRKRNEFCMLIDNHLIHFFLSASLLLFCYYCNQQCDGEAFYIFFSTFRLVFICNSIYFNIIVMMRMMYLLVSFCFVLWYSPLPNDSNLICLWIAYNQHCLSVMKTTI